MKFKKAPGVGSLTLHMGNADRRVEDGEILEGPEFEKFVAHGLLVRLPEEAPVKKPAAKTTKKAKATKPKADDAEAAKAAEEEAAAKAAAEEAAAAKKAADDAAVSKTSTSGMEKVVKSSGKPRKGKK